MDDIALHSLSFTDNAGRTVDLASFSGRPLLIVNTASKCGFTPQYEALQRIHESYADRGLVVIGFPCDQFGHQEPGSDDEIAAFCQRDYGVTFTLSTKVEVNGPGTHPVFAALKERAGGAIGSSIKWNFTKFLVSRDGRSVRRYAPTTTPDELVPDIEDLLEA